MKETKLKRKEAAMYMGVKGPTVTLWRLKGKIKGTKATNKSFYLYDIADLDALKNKRKTLKGLRETRRKIKEEIFFARKALKHVNEKIRDMDVISHVLTLRS
tara:strand:+ start:2298 stop:2603 length:306 start_codon:yes stop_codon:yes gene_type:complete